MERQEGEGGLSLPSYLYYYWPANIHKMMFWVSGDDSLVWSLLEQHSSNPVSLHSLSLSCAPLPLSKHYWMNNPIIHGSLKIWFQFRLNKFLFLPLFWQMSTLLHLSRIHLSNYSMREGSGVLKTILWIDTVFLLNS